MNVSRRKAYINSFIDQCFRNEADKDYIAARMNYKLGLMQQFLWSALQAIEKYLKAILLYNNRNAKTGHSLSKALSRVKLIKVIKFQISKDMERFITEYLDKYGNNRYLEHPSSGSGEELLWLDKAVWEIRRYCQDFDVWSTPGPKGRIHLRKQKLKELKSNYYKKNPHKFKIPMGYLEKVLKEGNKNEVYRYLICKNFFYGRRKKKKLKRYIHRAHSSVPVLYQYPEIYRYLKDKVQFPKSVDDYFEGRLGPVRRRVAGKVYISRPT